FLPNCNRSVFLVNPGAIENILYVHPDIKRSHALFIGKESILHMEKYIFMYGIPCPRMKLRWKCVLQSGIHNKMRENLQSHRKCKVWQMSHERKIVNEAV